VSKQQAINKWKQLLGKKQDAEMFRYALAGDGSSAANYDVGGSSGGVAYVYYWSQGQGAWQDKTGNLGGYGVTSIRDIERDSGGAP